mmetsp:Transcript_30604/g.34906  ORF Transcript_30604/g.34906 Transcript_30604/m.34906 type:complete len:150 (-) Transcript_30604:174-623(-)|eukprot:CAMPEP_0194149968 /NCGR_PEP_ID=MMETSP0152-20130528/40800_1 /TAXON_ID=1049557 /ORGANISM="Thalassiothrix antarctica, Strain L6-D1" /LENGTH=149 /DNA_ID=CAMNT_0038852543 /DNA_START=54 /DNA_END=503 /DNA_ORIENTATION=+
MFTKKQLSEVTEAIYTTAADVVTDWAYYMSVRDYEGPDDISMAEIPLLIFAIVSTLMLVAITIAAILNQFGKVTDRQMQIILAVEILVADVPQMIITGLVEAKKSGSISQAALISIATSVYNVFHDALSMLRKQEDIEVESPSGDEENK